MTGSANSKCGSVLAFACMFTHKATICTTTVVAVASRGCAPMTTINIATLGQLVRVDTRRRRSARRRRWLRAEDTWRATDFMTRLLDTTALALASSVCAHRKKLGSATRLLDRRAPVLASCGHAHCTEHENVEARTLTIPHANSAHNHAHQKSTH